MSIPGWEAAMKEPIRSAPPVPDCESVQGLIGGAAFWAAGAVCLAAWAALMAFVLWFLK